MLSRRRPKRERDEQQPPAPEIVTEDISEGDVMPRNVSKRWYKAANTKSLWTIPEVQHASKENFVPYVPRRPSPFIREMRTFLAVNGDNYSNALIGFQNLGAETLMTGDHLSTYAKEPQGSFSLLIF